MVKNLLDWLTKTGVSFTKDTNSKKLHLTREGGHSHRRIAHVADTTGRAIQDRLIETVLAHPNIHIFEDHIAVDLITSSKINITADQNICLGAYILENKTNKVFTIKSDNTILATGGASKVYLYTTNPDVSHRRWLRHGLERWLHRFQIWNLFNFIQLALSLKRYVLSYLRGIKR